MYQAPAHIASSAAHRERNQKSNQSQNRGEASRLERSEGRKGIKQGAMRQKASACGAKCVGVLGTAAGANWAISQSRPQREQISDVKAGEAKCSLKKPIKRRNSSTTVAATSQSTLCSVDKLRRAGTSGSYAQQSIIHQNRQETRPHLCCMASGVSVKV